MGENNLQTCQHLYPGQPPSYQPQRIRYPPSFSNSKFFFKIIALLKYNSQTINFIFLKYTIQVYEELSNHHHNLIIFTLKRNLGPTGSHFSFPVPPAPSNHYFCFYGFVYSSKSTFQNEFFTPVLLLLYSLFFLSCSIQYFLLLVF